MQSTKVSYIKKPYAKNGFISLGLAVVSLISFLIGISLGIRSQGNVGLHVAAIGFCSLLFGIAAVIYGILSFQEKEKKYIMAKVGIWSGLIVAVFWLIMIVIGLRV